MRYLVRYRRGPKSAPFVSLTFDDGPSLSTGKILDILKEQGIKAAFFLMPENVQKLPEVAKRIMNEGHEVGGHVYQPEVFPKWKSFWEHASHERIRHSVEVIHDILGIAPRFFRPSPELALNRGTEKILKKLDLIPILASAYSRVNRPVGVQIKDITAGLKPGAIILLHDGHDLKTDSERPKDTIELLPTIIEAVRTRTLDFVTVSELVGIPPYKK